MLGELDDHLGLSFAYWKNDRPGLVLLVLCHADLGEGQCSQNIAMPVNSSDVSFLIPVIQGYASVSAPCSGIFTVVSCQICCLIIVRGTEVVTS